MPPFHTVSFIGTVFNLFTPPLILHAVDSGGQYLDGTTDVTRTFFYGSEPDPEWVDRYTRVLMGKIDLARAVFPDGTLETALDYATRQHLFNAGLDYK